MNLEEAAKAGFPGRLETGASSMEELLSVSDLRVHFPIRTRFFAPPGGYVYAVDGVSFRLGRAETLGHLQALDDG